VFYADTGDIYRFGNELPSTRFEPDARVQITTSGRGLGVRVLEAGPLRVRLQTTVAATPPGGTSGLFVREYALTAGEPFLRMTTTGAAPSGYSVITRFPLASHAATIDHGTGGHWTNVQPAAAWAPPIFRATHDFLLPRDSSGGLLGAVYHAGMPAWAIDGSGALLGCLLRNTPGSRANLGATGSDDATHAQQYALRVPSGLTRPRRPAVARGASLQHAVAGDHGAAEQQRRHRRRQPRLRRRARDPDGRQAGSFDPASLVLRLSSRRTGRRRSACASARRPPAAAGRDGARGRMAGPAHPAQADRGRLRPEDAHRAGDGRRAGTRRPLRPRGRPCLVSCHRGRV
jgi:hypothetical protein